MSIFFRSRAETRAMDAGAFLTSGASPLRPADAPTVSRALSLTPVFAATRILADDTACLPLQQYRREPSGARVERPLSPLFQQPAAEGSAYDWVFQAVSSLTLTGNTTGVITGRDSRMNPTGVEWLHPESVEIVKVDGAWEWFWNGIRVDRQDVVHIAGYTMAGSPVGLSPIAAFALSLETGLGAASFGRDWFRNGSTPSAVLESDLPISEDQAKRLKARFKEAARGRDIVAMGIGTRYKPISVPAGESQFLESTRMTATQIANVYGLRPERIGGESGNSLTYANVEQNSINDASALRPWVARLESCFRRFSPPGEYVRFNLDAIIRADLKTRYEAHAIGIGSGFLLPNEARALEDRPPLPPENGAP